MAPLGQGTIGELGLGEIITTGSTTPAFSSLLPWFVPLSEPVRFRPGLMASEQQFAAFHPNPVVSFSWFEGLSEPPRFPRRLPPGEVQFDAYVPNQLTIIPFNWFEALSEPPRFPPGLKPSEQQFLAHPPQLRPNPKTSAAMASIERKDTFLGGVRVWLRVNSAEIGVIEMAFTGSEIGIVEMATAPGTPESGIIEQQTAPSPGSPVAANISAHVSIREV